MIQLISAAPWHRSLAACLSIVLFTFTHTPLFSQEPAPEQTEHSWQSEDLWVDNLDLGISKQNQPCTDQNPSRLGYIVETWPEGIVPFQFSSGLDATKQQQILDAMAEWSSAGYIRFIPRDGHANYLFFQRRANPAPGVCGTSSVGMKGGIQKVFINCFRSRVILHEIGHALGFFHEHQRPDRNDYVIINWQYIQKDRCHNFWIEDDGLLASPYDFESIMHYPWQAFSINGNYTIQTLPEYRAYQTVMGTGTQLSQLDREGAEAVYPFPPFHGVSHLWHESDFCDPQSNHRARIGHLVRYQNNGYDCPTSTASNTRDSEPLFPPHSEGRTGKRGPHAVPLFLDNSGKQLGPFQSSVQRIRSVSFPRFL